MEILRSSIDGDGLVSSSTSVRSMVLLDRSGLVLVTLLKSSPPLLLSFSKGVHEDEDGDGIMTSVSITKIMRLRDCGQSTINLLSNDSGGARQKSAHKTQATSMNQHDRRAPMQIECGTIGYWEVRTTDNIDKTTRQHTGAK